jgi:hypothetical protein
MTITDINYRQSVINFSKRFHASMNCWNVATYKWKVHNVKIETISSVSLGVDQGMS